MTKHVVATVGEIKPGECKIVTVKGREIGVFNIGDEYFALLNKCPHQGAALCKGNIVSRLESSQPGQYALSMEKEIIRCPWHCWEFEIKTGKSWCEPESVYVRRYRAGVSSRQELIEGHVIDGEIAVETFPVRVEEAYVVVEV